MDFLKGLFFLLILVIPFNAFSEGVKYRAAIVGDSGAEKAVIYLYDKPCTDPKMQVIIKSRSTEPDVWKAADSLWIDGNNYIGCWRDAADDPNFIVIGFVDNNIYAINKKAFIETDTELLQTHPKKPSPPNNFI